MKLHEREAAQRREPCKESTCWCDRAICAAHPRECVWCYVAVLCGIGCGLHETRCLCRRLAMRFFGLTKTVTCMPLRCVLCAYAVFVLARSGNSLSERTPADARGSASIGSPERAFDIRSTLEAFRARMGRSKHMLEHRAISQKYLTI